MKPYSYWQARLKYLVGRQVHAVVAGDRFLLKPLAREVALAKRRMKATRRKAA